MALTALQMINELLSRFSLPEVAVLSGTTGADDTIALRKLNIAQQIIATAHPFKWTQKTTPGTLTAVAGTSTYSLASDVSKILIAKHTYNGGGWIKVIDRSTLESYRPDRSQTADRNVPKFMVHAGALQSSQTSLPLVQAELWPVPDANFDAQTITYYYTYVLPDLVTAADISLIPGDSHYVIIDLAETLWRTGPIRVGGDQNQVDLYTAAENRFKQGLMRLIQADNVSGFGEMSWETNAPEI